MQCALCQRVEANKKNTHYLTDAIIRSCLNEGGSNEREKGYFFSMDNGTPFMEFNFQRATSQKKLEEGLGRQPTEKEIEKAKDIPYSVDNVFCSECENDFTNIETDFIDKILPKFRNSDLSDITNLQFEDIKLFRLFFYLQIWRSAICEPSFKLSSEAQESLREFILNHPQYKGDEINKFPLIVYHLETTGEQIEYTTNIVGYITNDTKHERIIFMNDFVIQFFENPEHAIYDSLYGLNKQDDWETFINYKEESFKVKIINNDNRKIILESLMHEEKVKKTLSQFANSLINFWLDFFGQHPNPFVIKEFINGIVQGDLQSVLQYSEQQIIDYTLEFVIQKLQV